MPSHLKDGKKIRPSTVSDEDIQANEKADELAGIAADLVQLPSPVATNFKHYVKLVATIQRRLASILLWLPPRGTRKEKKESQQHIPKKAVLLQETEHNITIRNNRYICATCNNNFHVSDPAAKHWLTTKCIGPPDSSQPNKHKPTKVDCNTIHIGNQSSHVSHDLYRYRGLTYCNKCGAYGSSHFNLLAKQCEAPKVAGLRTLRCINKGCLPCGLFAWPEQT